jgi:hypothetical protein
VSRASCNALRDKHGEEGIANHCISEPVGLYLLRAVQRVFDDRSIREHFTRCTRADPGAGTPRRERCSGRPGTVGTVRPCRFWS